MNGDPVRILLIEDNPGDARLIRELLREAGKSAFELECADLLSKGLERLAGGGIDVVLLDLGLPDSQGLETLARCQERAPDLPTVILTGLDDETVAVEAVQQGAQDYLVKGQITSDSLSRAVRYAVARKRAEETLRKLTAELARSNKELEQFAYAASHDLQEPLRKLLAFTDLLRKDLGDHLPERANKDMGFITESARRMRDLVDRTLELSRVGCCAREDERVSLAECSGQAIDMLSVRVAETSAEIARDELPEVRGDRTMLTQVYQNLIGNALKFAGERRPVIRLTAERTDGHWVLGVKDNGIGIKPDRCEEIFLPFKRLHGRGEYEGTGMGLAICRRCVERHGGLIWVESEPGRGAHFKFTLNGNREP